MIFLQRIWRLLIFLLFCGSTPSYAQLPDYHVQLFDESFGVRTSDVRKVLRDQQGFVWILHADLVQRFDGKRITEFTLDESLQTIYCDRDNRIWVTSFSKLFCLSDDRKRFRTVSIDTIRDLRISTIYQLPGKEVWILTTRGFYILDSTTRLFKKHPDPVLANLKEVQTRGMDNGPNSVFFSLPDSLVAYDLNTKVRTAMPLPLYNIRTVTALTNELAFVSIWKGIIYLYDFAKKQVREIDMSGQLKNVQDHFITIFQVGRLNKDKFLLATSKGLLEYDLSSGNFRQLRLFHKGKLLEGNLYFMDLHLDSKGTGWIAYNNYGVIRFRTISGEPGLIRNYEPDITRAWDNNVRNFAEDEKGNLWLATFNGFACWNRQTGNIETYFAKEGAKDRLNHPSIRGIVYDGVNLILGQTNRGIWIYNPRTLEYKRPGYMPGKEGETTRLKLEGSFIDQIYTLHNGNHVVSGNNGAYLLSSKTYIVSRIKFPGEKENLNFCYEDSRRNIWLGTDKNLYCLDTNFVHRFKIGISNTSGIVNSMCEWTDGSMIIGSNGLHRLILKDNVPAITTVHPFFSEVTIQILYKDLHDKLWLGTSEGLMRYDMQTQKIASFSNFENIEGKSFYRNSYWRSSRGMLFLGSNRGIIYFNPEKIAEEQDSLNVFVSKVIVNEDDSSFFSRKTSRLKYFQNTVAFEFVSPYYRNANKLKYRYRLQGLDTGWTANGNSNTARFHALRPGSYEFHAAASINGIDWFETSENIAFSINPPFWNTWWFIILVTLLVAAGLFALYRYQLNKKLEVERLRLGIARDLHDDIGSALSNIHIISSMAVKKQHENGDNRKVFGKIRESSKTILENMHDIVWAINPENDTLEQVISRMKEFAGEICEAAGVEYNFDVDTKLESTRLTVNKRKDLFLVFKEAINNAVKYSGCTRVDIRLQKDQHNQLSLQVRDNGKGFERASIRPGNGLKNMEMRARQVKGSLRIESGKGEGTVVEFQIPLT